MKYPKLITSALLLTGIFSLIHCDSNDTSQNNYLIKVAGNSEWQSSYRNQAGETIIPAGKYAALLSDTFRTYAMVLHDSLGFIVIDRQEKVLYEVFIYDNGPDYPEDGLFRITKNGKIGYADAESYQVVIPPQFDCAFPFENGIAEVSTNCTTVSDEEHDSWISEDWRFIDREGREVTAPEGN